MIKTERLEAVSPLRKLSGGYGFIRDDEGHRVDSVKKLKKGDVINTTIRDGTLTSRIEDINFGG
jgi:exodeoxyribonuclease VII large subunit